MQHTPNRSKPSMKCRFWLPNRPQKMRRLSIRALQESSHSHHFPTQTQTHNRPSSQCSNLFSRCKTWSAAALLNSSWQLVRQMRKLRRSARSWHKQCGNWRVEVPCQNQGSKCPNLRVKWWYWMQSSLRAYLDSAAWISKAKKPSRGVCRTQPQKRDVWQRSANKKKMSYNLICLWFWIRFIAVFFYLSLSRIGEAENPGPVCATAKLFGAKYDAIGQWAQNLSSKSVVELEPLFAQVGSEKIPSPTHHWSVRTSTALTVIRIFLLRLLSLCMSVTLHALSNFCYSLSLFKAWKVRSEVTPFVIARPEEDAHWEETQVGAFQRCGEYSPMQRDYLE